ncbi:MAG: hypothetical protein HOI95_11150 [Chromatiales bacterium]|jgi:membrane-bound ClpP family serine protease|nr:hypothetical protein [Chromatiales bacterium]
MEIPSLWTAIGLVILAFALLIAEFFIVSFGLLLAMAIASVGTGIYIAFSVSAGTGWAFVVVVPILTVAVVRWGLQKICRSHVVPKAEITAEAGYHHVADRMGVGVGAIGVMTTTARPSGRARFDGGQCDVQARGRPLEQGDAVRVSAIDGPIVFVDQIAADELCDNGEKE